MAEPDKNAVEVTEKLDLLIGPRRSFRAKSAGIQPLSTMAMSSAISALNRMPGAEIVREIRPKGRLKTLSASDEAATVYKVRADIETAVQLVQTAQPNLAVELDSSLTYGNSSSSLLQELVSRHLYRSGGAAQRQQIDIRIVGPKGEPVNDTTVLLEAQGFPQQGQTDKNGIVSFTALAADGRVNARSLYISPSKEYWNRHIKSPTLLVGTLNQVRLQTLKEIIPGFPKNFAYGWGQRFMGLDQLPDEYTGKGVKIAIIDSGADNKHSVLKHIRTGIDLTNNYDTASWSTDDLGHGSHCAGIIAGQNSGTAAMRGFAPEAEVHIFKVFPGGQFSSLLDALSYCIELGIDVVNMSLGGADTSDAVEQALDEAVQNGIACVVAAGNSGGPVQYPASSSNVLAVAALGKIGEFPSDSWEASQQSKILPDGIFSPSFTCFGPEIAVAAPGVGIVSTVPGGFQPQSGTSMAAPHVTGLAALLLAHHPLFKGPLSKRNPDRVAALFQLIRSLSAPIQLEAERSGAGVPLLNGLGELFGSEEPSELGSQSHHMFGPTGAAVGFAGGLHPFQIAPNPRPQSTFGSAPGGHLGGNAGLNIGGVYQVTPIMYPTSNVPYSLYLPGPTVLYQ